MAKIPATTPDDLEWREIHRLELITPAMGGPTTFDGNDDPTAGHMNAQAIQIMTRTEMLRHRNPSGDRNALILGKMNANGHTPDYLSTPSVSEIRVFFVFSDPLIMSFANGYGPLGAVDFIATT